MNRFVMIALLMMVPEVYGAQTELSRCLGAEEKQFHLRKEIGPLYDLNQRLISEVIQIPNAALTPQDYFEVCSRKGGSPSIRLLEYSIRRGRALFKVTEGVSGSQLATTMGMIDDYLDNTKDILLNLVTQIQSQAPSSTCIQEEIPALNKLFMEIKYLQEDVDMQKIFQGKDLAILEKLKDYPAAYDRCRARLKKKLKSGSKEAPKKP